ncbi:MAG: hypothetical protein IJ017_02875 [Oscillospiraceae bacterium]|nr:hypothetical protein [Oscillospiraceae bacterium]
MRKFWGFYDNGIYKVGCNGQTMYLYDADDRELGKFKDISYAYCGAFIPQANIFVLRSTDGRIAVYDCDERKLLHKFRFSDVDGSQDDGFCFSVDGKYFINIEKVGSSTRTRLSIYETKTFSLVKQLFDNETNLVLSNIEYNISENQYNVLFFVRDNNSVYSQGYVGELHYDQLINMQPLDSKSYDFLHSYKSLETSGFTEKAIEWSGLHYSGYSNDEILKFRDMNIRMVSFLQIAKDVIK